MPSPLQEYLTKIRDIRALGAATEETSYYEPLQILINAAGKALRPNVFCLANLHDQGAGFPDFWLYTANQLRRARSMRDPIPDEPPERGVVEVKGVDEDARAVAAGKQVTKYWEHYSQVLVTNYRAFILVGRDQFGQRLNLEHFALAESPEAFWDLVEAPGQAPDAMALRLEEFLKRVLLHNAQLSNPRDVAWFLASYARDGLARIEEAGEVPALDLVRSSLEEALGMTFEGAKGQHFFHSTLVQTLFYGLFSAWVLWCKQNPDEESRKGFDYRSAHWHMRLPVLRALFEQVNSPGKLGPLRLDELMEWAALTLRRVDARAFFSQFREDHAVLYFYEPFLAAFDPELRKQLGVWYTPPEVVEYMVERVDTVLREELGVADGLADPNVYVLDPCCGTGSYLVAVLKRIERTLRDKGEDALIGADVKQAALDRVFGFELLPAPFVVAHLQLGLLLEELGIELDKRFVRGSEEFERPAVYLTNALTGWTPPKDRDHHLPLPELEDEMDRAGDVKVAKPVLVVLGNPPYNGYASVGVDEERNLTAAYRTVRRVRPPEGQGLNDLYVRFYRMAERRIVEHTGKGVVCLISNYSWLDGLSFTGMRERYLGVFDKIWIDCLNGDKYKTGKLTPDGEPDPSIFSTEQNRQGIQVGTAIALMVRKEDHGQMDAVRFRNLWGRNKHAELLESTVQDGEALYEAVDSPLALGLPFTPVRVSPAYLEWPLLPGLFPVSFPGVKTSRDEALVDIDRERLVRRMERYFDPETGDADMRRIAPALMRSTARFDAKAVRRELQQRGILSDKFIRYSYRPFDVRWLYWEPKSKLLDEKRTEYFHSVASQNLWLSAGQRNRKEVFYQPQVTSTLADHHIVESNVAMFPLRDRTHAIEGKTSEGEAIGWKPNITRSLRDYVEAAHSTESDVFCHVIALLHATEYREENSGALRQDWPRVPLPTSNEVLGASASLGRELAALLDSETPVRQVTAGPIRSEMKAIGPIRRVSGGRLSEKHLRLTARWGYAGQNRVTMPGPGDARVRDYTEDERAAIVAGARVLGLGDKQAFDCLGATTYDIHLNDVAYWRNVPERVWSYTLGGYQVIKKWLSYREYELLGRPLKTEEAREVTNIARRIAAILLMEPALDANYRAVHADTYAWPAAD